MGQEEDLKQAVGLADACELLSYAFAYPDERLAQGLVDGALADDARACLSDAGVAANGASAAAERLRVWQGASVEETLSVMRKTYSRLYLAPGGHTPIFPYESAFLHVERGLPGIPALFRTSVTLDVERHMREAGVAAKNGRKEPCDSVFEEFEFLSYLHAKRAEALHCNDGERAAAWARRIGAFEEEHVSMWLPTFMRRTQELAEGTPYAAFAALGLATMGERS
ncbi:TorD/DmsD family molecular chaperone [Eggerthella sinensis]|uniref:TorD/DmsD family molecular chaperone n=1 Tax=Eggerthella sinensis TaxID=242230 RepID=UPI001D08E7AD|nr:molecular chaperone TorD family protein [Eggerthella sinensis]MCB7036752.1 molecular chaperone TorD family protein [Eggerthella sinensis]